MILQVHPWKLTCKNEGRENDLPFQTGDVFGSSRSFSGVKNYHLDSKFGWTITRIVKSRLSSLLQKHVQVDLKWNFGYSSRHDGRGGLNKMWAGSGHGSGGSLITISSMRQLGFTLYHAKSPSNRHLDPFGRIVFDFFEASYANPRQVILSNLWEF